MDHSGEIWGVSEKKFCKTAVILTDSDEQGCPGNTRAGNTGREIPRNTVRDIRDRPDNTGKYRKKKTCKSYTISRKGVYMRSRCRS